MSEMSESLKKEIADFVTTYTDIKLSQLAFVKTAIAKVTGVGTTKGNKISIAGLAKYDDIQSLGDVVYPTDSIVFALAPNNQWTNAFILGQLFASPANIDGGTINIGNGQFIVDSSGVTMNNNDETTNLLTINGGTSDWDMYLSPLQIRLTNTSTNIKTLIQSGGSYIFDGLDDSTDVYRTAITRGNINLYNSSGILQSQLYTGRLSLNDLNNITRAKLENDGYLTLYDSAGATRAIVS